MRRVIIKLSGEALANTQDRKILDFDSASDFVDDVLQLLNIEYKVAVVIGGGNICRGRDYANGIDRSDCDYLGMLATCLNGHFLHSAFKAKGIRSVVFGAYAVDGVIPKYSRDDALKYYNDGYVVIFAGGLGVPFISTDCCAVMRGGDLGSDIVLKSTNIDGVYDKNPHAHNDAVRYDRISYNDYIKQGLRVVDPQAIITACDLNIKFLIFQSSKGAIYQLLHGKHNISYTTIG